MTKSNFQAYQARLNSKFDKAYSRAIKDAAEDSAASPTYQRPERRDVFGTTPKGPSSPPPKYQTRDLNDTYLRELDTFVKTAISQIETFKRNDPGVNFIRRTFDEWVAKLNYLKQENPVQAKVIDIAIKNLWALYKNEVKKGPNMGKQEDRSNLRLSLSIFADVHWWDKVKQIFIDLNKYIQRSFVRPTVVPLPKPGTLPQVEAPNPDDYALNKEGKLERVYSTDQLVIIESIRKYAIKVILVSKNVQTNIASVSDIMPLYLSSIDSLVKEEAKVAAAWKGTFKAIKINLHFLNRMRNAIDDPYDDVIIKRLEKEKQYAENIVKNSPQRLSPNMNIYGTKLSNYNAKDDDYGFRPRQSGVGSPNAEGSDVYDLRKEIFRIYGDGYATYQLKLYAEEQARKKRAEEEVDNENDILRRDKQPFSTTQATEVVNEGKMDLATYLAKGNYVDPSHVVFNTRVSAPSFRKFDPKLDIDTNKYSGEQLYKARAAIWQLWSDAFRVQLKKFNELVDDLKKAQSAKQADIPVEYAGVKVNNSKFRNYDVKLDNNMNFYLIKKRTWLTYHSLQIAYENDIVIGDFGKLYEKTVDFVDSFVSTIEQITKDPKSMGVLGDTGSPILNDFQKMINDVEEFNQMFTTSPWSKSFILNSNMLSTGSDNDYANRLLSLKGNISTIQTDLNLIETTLKEETDALQQMIRSINKVDANQKNPFLEYYSDLEFPKTNAITPIANYINQYLETTKDPQFDAYGISYILGQIS